MKITNNHRIISLYSAVFIIISLITIYIPVWLNETIGLEVKDVGIFFGLIGILKFFSTTLITINIKNFNNYKNTSLYISVIISLIYIIIFFLLNKDQNFLIVLLIFLSLIVCSPILPIAESVCIKLNKNFFNTYGKLRISGSIAFLFGAIMIGYLIESFGPKSVPFLMIFLFFFFLISIFLLPPEKTDNNNNNNNSSNLYELISNKKFMIVLLCCSLIQGSHAMYYSFASILWKKNALSFLQIGQLWGWGVLAEIILFYFIDKINIKSFFVKVLIFVSIISLLRWVLTFYFKDFYLLLLIQTLHAISFGLTHYLMMFFIFVYISNNNKLLAQALYHGFSSGLVMTILTFVSGYSFLYYNNAEGFLIMAMSCAASTLVIAISSLWIKYEK